jgi:tetratricopeptide (TPR) repeat protein
VGDARDELGPEPLEEALASKLQDRGREQPGGEEEESDEQGKPRGRDASDDEMGRGVGVDREPNSPAVENAFVGAAEGDVGAELGGVRAFRTEALDTGRVEDGRENQIVGDVASSEGRRQERAGREGPSKDALDRLRVDDEASKGTANLAKLEKPAAVRVDCFTCHHGLSRPGQIEIEVETALDARGIDGAIARYRELKAEHFGSSAYDFGVGPLNGLGEELLGSGRPEAARALLELNAESFPDSGWLQHLLGEAYLATGERDKARTAFERALEIDPRNAMAKKKLEELAR